MTRTRIRKRDPRPAQPIPQVGAVSSDLLAALLYGTSAESNVVVNERSVSGLPAVDAGVSMISNAVATMMTSAAVYGADDSEVTPTPPVVERPSVLLGSFEFWEQATTGAMRHGNYVGILADFAEDGWPRQVVPVHPSAVSLDVASGLPLYRIGDAVYLWDEVVHVRYGAPVGSYWGVGIIEKYRKELSLQLHEQAYGESSFKDGAVPSAVIQLDALTVKQETAEAYQERWLDRHGGGRRKPAVIPKNIGITPIGWSPADAEFAESRKISVAEAALMCGLEPADLGAAIATGTGQLVYQNLNDRQLDRVVRAFSPWMQRFEQAWSDLLPIGQYVRGNPEALLRTTTRERYEIHELAQRIKLQTVNETRAIEKRPPLEASEETTTEEATDDAA